jgi:hypothetical protein
METSAVFALFGDYNTMVLMEKYYYGLLRGRGADMAWTLDE